MNIKLYITGSETAGLYHSSKANLREPSAQAYFYILEGLVRDGYLVKVPSANGGFEYITPEEIAEMKEDDNAIAN
jgi:hypothetical protein